MTFKDAATADLSVFLNVDEFADSIEIDGVTVACVLEGAGDTDAAQEGVINADTVIHARASDFEEIPSVGQRLTVDGRQADVIAVGEDQGILTIHTRWWDS